MYITYKDKTKRDEFLSSKMFFLEKNVSTKDVWYGSKQIMIKLIFDKN